MTLKPLKPDSHLPKTNVLNSKYILDIQIFVLTFGSYRKNDLIRKIRLNFKIYDVTTWLTIIAMNILPNISRRKSKKTRKFDQLIEYNKNIFLQKPCR